MVTERELANERYESRLKVQRDYVMVMEWIIDEARKASEARQAIVADLVEVREASLFEGAITTRISNLLRILSHRFKTSVPDDLQAKLWAVTDRCTLDDWLDASLDAASLEDFRRITGI